MVQRYHVTFLASAHLHLPAKLYEEDWYSSECMNLYVPIILQDLMPKHIDSFTQLSAVQCP